MPIPVRRVRRITFVLLTMVLLSGFEVAAQTADPAAAPQPPRETDLTVVNVPTTYSLRRHQSYFRLTHRFARDLRRGDFGSLVEDLFSLDNGAVIGLEYRFGLASNLQAGVHRSMLSKTIQFFGKYDALRQGEPWPVSISVMGSVEGLNNFGDDYQAGVALVFSHMVNGAVSLYVSPAFVGRSRTADFLDDHEDHDHDIPGAEDETSTGEHTTLLGLGGRFRILRRTFISAEYSPRLAGYDPGRGTWGVAIERQTGRGGHTLQLNFTNSFGTTLGQLARGGSDHDIYLGFNITRKF
jgi:hypothetical protein